MMCVQEAPRNHTEMLMARKFKGNIREYKVSKEVSLPDTVDWRTGGAVTFVKDQVMIFISHNAA